MKTLHLLLVALLISLYYCENEEGEGSNNENYCEDLGTPSKAKDCHNRKLDPNTDEKYCCFLDFGDGESECEGYTQRDYNKVDEYIDAAEKANEKLSIDCSSNYIIISLLSLILLFL